MKQIPIFNGVSLEFTICVGTHDVMVCFREMTCFYFVLFLGFLVHSNVKNVRKTLHLLFFALKIVIKYKLLDEIGLKFIKHANLV